jgi:hypothetical protein
MKPGQSQLFGKKEEEAEGVTQSNIPCRTVRSLLISQYVLTSLGRCWALLLYSRNVSMIWAEQCTSYPCSQCTYDNKQYSIMHARTIDRCIACLKLLSEQYVGMHAAWWLCCYSYTFKYSRLLQFLEWTHQETFSLCINWRRERTDRDSLGAHDNVTRWSRFSTVRHGSAVISCIIIVTISPFNLDMPVGSNSHGMMHALTTVQASDACIYTHSITMPHALASMMPSARPMSAPVVRHSPNSYSSISIKRSSQASQLKVVMKVK